MAAEADRLARVEARLHQLEEPTTSAYDVVVKTVAEQWVLATSVEVASTVARAPRTQLLAHKAKILRHAGITGGPTATLDL